MVKSLHYSYSQNTSFIVRDDTIVSIFIFFKGKNNTFSAKDGQM
jgi:hypothetical protein